jgi:membrane protein DedA with SNARE-associated domain
MLLVIGLVQKSGYYLYNKQDSFGSKENIQSKDFFEKYGGKSHYFRSFSSNISNFAPIVAGIVSMDKQKFMFYNILSSFIWSFTLIFGHYLYFFTRKLSNRFKRTHRTYCYCTRHNSFTSNLQV